MKSKGKGKEKSFSKCKILAVGGILHLYIGKRSHLDIKYGFEKCYETELINSKEFCPAEQITGQRPTLVDDLKLLAL